MKFLIKLIYRKKEEKNIMSFVTDSILKTALGKIKAWGEGKFVAQETGKGLSSNDYTSAEKT